MIRSFQNSGLKELFETGRSAKIGKTFHLRVIRRLDALQAATKPEDMNIPGFEFHALRGTPRYSVHVKCPWCITFLFVEGHAERVDFDRHH
jgi:toxin HigB-1